MVNSREEWMQLYRQLYEVDTVLKCRFAAIKLAGETSDAGLYELANRVVSFGVSSRIMSYAEEKVEFYKRVVRNLRRRKVVNEASIERYTKIKEDFEWLVGHARACFLPQVGLNALTDNALTIPELLALRRRYERVLTPSKYKPSDAEFAKMAQVAPL